MKAPLTVAFIGSAGACIRIKGAFMLADSRFTQSLVRSPVEVFRRVNDIDIVVGRYDLPAELLRVFDGLGEPFSANPHLPATVPTRQFARQRIVREFDHAVVVPTAR